MSDDHPTGPDDDRNPFGNSNPFGAMFPMFGDLARQMQSQGPLNWDAARQFAVMGATQGTAEPNVDPTVRIAYADLARIVGPQVNDVSGAGLTFPEPRVITRSQWATETLEAYRPLFTDLANSLGQQPTVSDVGDDPLSQMMSGLNQMVAPAMLGMAVGSMVGSMAQRVFGVHDLPIPRSNLEIVLVDANVDAFVSEWELAGDEVRLWVLAHQLAGFTVFSIPHLREGIAELVRHHVGAFQPDPTAIGDKIGELESADDPMAAVQQVFSDPEILLGAVSSPEQQRMRPQLDAAIAMVVGYTDWMVDAVAARMVGGDALTIAEAARRRRLASATDDVFIERLLGIRLGTEQVTRGKAFIQGVVDRVGESDLHRLLNDPRSMPTPAEIEAPGLWIARLDES